MPKGNSCKCRLINGMLFPTLREAAAYLGMDANVLGSRLDKNQWPFSETMPKRGPRKLKIKKEFENGFAKKP